MSDLLDRIASFEEHAARLESRLADPGLAAQPGEYGRVAKELKSLRPLVEAAARYRAALAELEGARALLADPDPEVSALARGELEELERTRTEIEGEIRRELVPKDPNDEKNAILEIRAGAGGDEAALFANDLFRMYGRYAERRGWKVELLSISRTEGGGLKEGIPALLQGLQLLAGHGAHLLVVHQGLRFLDLAGHVLVLAILRDRLLQLGVALGDLPVALLVRHQGRIAHLLRELVEPAFDGRKTIQDFHVTRLPCRNLAPRGDGRHPHGGRGNGS